MRNEQVLSGAGRQRSDKVLIEYLESWPVVVPGPVTGRAYAFSLSHTVQPVLADDAEELERTGFFRRVDGQACDSR